MITDPLGKEITTLEDAIPFMQVTPILRSSTVLINERHIWIRARYKDDGRMGTFTVIGVYPYKEFLDIAERFVEDYSFTRLGPEGPLFAAIYQKVSPTNNELLEYLWGVVSGCKRGLIVGEEEEI